MRFENGGASEEVIDSMHLILGHQLGKQLIEAGGALLVSAERLLQHQRRASRQR